MPPNTHQAAASLISQPNFAMLLMHDLDLFPDKFSHYPFLKRWTLTIRSFEHFQELVSFVLIGI
jgi:hypothetical protein